MKYLYILILAVIALGFNGCSDDFLENDLASDKVEFELGLSTPDDRSEERRVGKEC